MASQPRLLSIGPPPDALAGALAADVVTVPDPAAATDRLRAERFDAVLCDPAAVAALLADRTRDELVFSAIQNGIAILNEHGAITWAHPVFVSWCSGDPVGRPLVEALGGRPDQADPLAAARLGRPVAFVMQRPDRVYLEVTVRPGGDRQFVAYVRNVTETVEQQRKLDALHQAGRDLAGLDPDLLDEMNVPTRVELLKQNLRRSIRDLLHYDIIEVRLLDRRTGELKPLLEDGMTPEASRRVLYAQETGNGVTGYVAATGRSYLCPDTAQDPLYLEGATGAGSSMTVPLKYHDEVVGTLNVESPRTNGFAPDDLQFAELFSKEIAAALHTLDLLTAQQSCTAAQSVDAVNREVVMPVDEILGSAAVLLAKVGDADPDVAEHLRRILGAARAVKESVRKVGRDLAAGETAAPTPLGGKRVLVVDADERARRSAHLLLGRLGAAVETAGTASEGVALLAGAPFDVVLMDVKPPDMGGYEAYRRLRAARPEAAVAMTTGFGYDTAHSIVKARADGMRYVLFKPFRQDQLVKAVLDGAPLAATGTA